MFEMSDSDKLKHAIRYVGEMLAAHDRRWAQETVDAQADAELDGENSQEQRSAAMSETVRERWPLGQIPWKELSLHEDFPSMHDRERVDEILRLSPSAEDAYTQVTQQAANDLASSVQNAVASLRARAATSDLAEKVWAVLRSAPYETFDEEPWDGLRTAQRILDTHLDQIAPTESHAGHSHHEVFPALAVALAALHAAQGGEGSLGDLYQNWDS